MKRLLLVIFIVISLVTILSAVPRNRCLVEIATGTWCYYCPGAALAAEGLFNNNIAAALVEYHTGDTFSTTDSEARCTYYSVSGVPTGWFDGLNAMVGGDHVNSLYTTYLPRVNARLNTPSHYNIAVGGSSVGGIYHLLATIDKTEADSNTDLRFHAVLTESGINFAWQGLTSVEFVERLMLPNYLGTSIDFGTGDQVVVPLNFTFNNAWVPANCKLVFFLQNNATKEVMQAIQFNLSDLQVASPVTRADMPFPETFVTGSTTKMVSINNYWDTPLVGSITSSNPMFQLSQTARLDFSIAPYQSSTYALTFTPTTEGIVNGTLDVTTNVAGYETVSVPVSGSGYFNSPPVASDVEFSGIPVPTMMQAATYTYTDPDNDTEGPTTYQWFRITPPSTTPVPIADATGLTYRLTAADVGSQIVFKVFPIDYHLMPGLPAASEPSALIEPLPAPQELTYSVIDNHDVVLNWLRPTYFTRDFLGYRIFRSGLPISVINNSNTLTFTDTWLNPGEYQYWVTSVFTNPVSQSGPSNVVTVNIVSNNDNTAPVIESMSVYPNPFRTNALINVTTKANAVVTAGLYNLKGQLVQTLSARTDANGSAMLNLDRNAEMLSGLYFVKVTTPNGTKTQKVMVLK